MCLFGGCCACYACYALASARHICLKINTILRAYPLNSSWRQHLAGATHTKARKGNTVVCHPTLEGLVVHSCRFGKFVFVGASHSFFIFLQRYEKSERNANKIAFIFTSERTSSSTKSRYDIILEYPRKIRTFSHIIWTYLDTTGQKWTAALATVVTLHRQSGTTHQRVRFYSSAEEKLLLRRAVNKRPR